MTQTITYYDGSFSTALTTVPRSTVQWVESAELGQVGMGGFRVHDIDGTAGHSSDGIVGLKSIKVEESSCATARTFSGYIADRTYSRGEFSVGAGREIEVNVVDLNATLGFRIITGTDGKRSAETVSARLTWLLASDYLTGLVVDGGYVDYPTDKNMDATDYRGMTPAEVLADCAVAAARNYFVYYDTTASGAALWFADSNTSTSWTSSLQISNVMSDVDSTTTFAPFMDARMTRDPQRVVAGAYVPYANGNVYLTRASTATTYAWRDRSAPNANVKTSSAASALAYRFLVENQTEDDRISVTIRVTPSKVNLIRAGMRMQAKFSHLPGYTSFTYFRVMRRTVSQPFGHDNVYDIALELSPQETFSDPCCGADALGGVMKYSSDTVVVPPFPTTGTPTYTFHANVSVPTATVSWISRPSNATGGAHLWNVEGTFNDGIGSWGPEGGVASNNDRIAVRYAVDLGSAKTICAALITKTGSFYDGQQNLYDGHPFNVGTHSTFGWERVYVQGSSDGSTWTTVANYDAVYASQVVGTTAVLGAKPSFVPCSGTYRYWAVVWDKQLSDGGFAGLISVSSNQGKFFTFSLYQPGSC